MMDERAYRLWLVERSPRWTPSTWMEEPPSHTSIVVKPAFDGTFSFPEAMASLESFNSQRLKNAPDNYWMVAVLVTVVYRNDLEPQTMFNAHATPSSL